MHDGKLVQKFFVDKFEAGKATCTGAVVAVNARGQHWGNLSRYLRHMVDAPDNIKTAIVQRMVITESMNSETIEDLCLTSNQTILPSQVSLGVGNSWFIRWSDGLCAWDLGPEPTEKGSIEQALYMKLRHLLGHSDSAHAPLALRQSVDSIVLDPWHPQRWFAVFNSGTRVEFSLPNRTIEKITPVLNAYTSGQRMSSTVISSNLPADDSILPFQASFSGFTNNSTIPTTKPSKVSAATNPALSHSQTSTAAVDTDEAPPQYAEEHLSGKKKSGRFWKRLFE